MLLALTLGTQVSAETLKDLLQEYASSSQFLELVTNAPIAEFQVKNRTKLDKLLSQDINAVTVDQIETIMGLMDSLVNTISPAIKQIPYYRHLSIDDAKTAFSELADEVKEELQEVMREAELQRLAKEAEQRLADEATALQRLAEATRLAEAPLLTPTIAAPTLSISMLGAEGSITTDPIANPLLTDRLAQFTKNLSNLDEESHSDAVNVNDVLLNHGGHLEEFQEKQNMSTATEQEYQDALALFFKKKGLKINYNILSNVATRLRKIQTPSFMLEDDGLDEESCTSPVSHSDSDSGTVFGSNDSGDDTVFASEEDDNDTVYNNEEDLKKTLSPLITQEERATFLQGRSEDREFNDAELLTRYRDEIISLDGPLTEELSAQVNKRIENLEDLLEQEKELNEIDSLLAQLEEEGAQGLDPVQLPSKKTNRSRSSEENRQRHRAMKIINQSSAEKFIKEFQDTLELLIFNKVMQDKQLLDKNGCKTLLLSFFQTLDLNNDYCRKYVQMLPQLVDELLVVQEGLKERRQRVLDSSAEVPDLPQPSSEETPAQIEKKQLSKARKAIRQGNTDTFIEHSRQNLQSLIRQAWQENNGKLLDRNGCVQLLIPFLNDLGFQPTDYNPMVPQLVTSLMSLQDEMSQNSQV